MSSLIALDLVPSFLELAYQHRGYHDFWNVISSLSEIDMNLIPLDTQFLSLLESYISSFSLPDSESLSEEMEILICFVAKNANQQALIDSKILRALFKVDDTENLLMDLVNDSIEQKRSTLVEHLMMVEFVRLIQLKRIYLYKIPDDE